MSYKKVIAVVSTVALSVTIFSLFSLVPVSAQTASERLDQAQEQIQERKDQYIENRCERVTFNIDNRIERYNSNWQRHTERYLKIKNNVTNFINKVEGKGYDVEELRSVLNDLDSQIQSAANTYSTVIDQLNDTKTFACGNSEGQFRSAVETANDYLQDFRAQVRDIGDFVREEVRSAIQAVRDQK